MKNNKKLLILSFALILAGREALASTGDQSFVLPNSDPDRIRVTVEFNNMHSDGQRLSIANDSSSQAISMSKTQTSESNSTAHFSTTSNIISSESQLSAISTQNDQKAFMLQTSAMSPDSANSLPSISQDSSQLGSKKKTPTGAAALFTKKQQQNNPDLNKPLPLDDFDNNPAIISSKNKPEHLVFPGEYKKQNSPSSSSISSLEQDNVGNASSSKPNQSIKYNTSSPASNARMKELVSRIKEQENSQQLQIDESEKKSYIDQRPSAASSSIELPNENSSAPQPFQFPNAETAQMRPSVDKTLLPNPNADIFSANQRDEIEIIQPISRLPLVSSPNVKTSNDDQVKKTLIEQSNSNASSPMLQNNHSKMQDTAHTTQNSLDEQTLIIPSSLDPVLVNPEGYLLPYQAISPHDALIKGEMKLQAGSKLDVEQNSLHIKQTGNFRVQKGSKLFVNEGKAVFVCGEFFAGSMDKKYQTQVVLPVSQQEIDQIIRENARVSNTGAFYLRGGKFYAGRGFYNSGNVLFEISNGKHRKMSIDGVIINRINDKEGIVVLGVQKGNSFLPLNPNALEGKLYIKDGTVIYHHDYGYSTIKYVQKGKQKIKSEPEKTKNKKLIDLQVERKEVGYSLDAYKTKLNFVNVTTHNISSGNLPKNVDFGLTRLFTEKNDFFNNKYVYDLDMNVAGQKGNNIFLAPNSNYQFGLNLYNSDVKNPAGFSIPNGVRITGNLFNVLGDAVLSNDEWTVFGESYSFPGGSHVTGKLDFEEGTNLIPSHQIVNAEPGLIVGPKAKLEVRGTVII
ncbi:hypothetical protein FACS1894113_2110 [Alphaproteobacteria bacterium]|nr:hypothetical protein FACS1894113_2110 [Alphaproteobacteria bacterium]